MMRDKKTAIRQEAEALLRSIGQATRALHARTEAYNTAATALAAGYDSDIATLRADIAAGEKAIKALMKANKGLLFDAADVVDLSPGSLIYSAGDKVTIPKTALAECEAQGFTDVVKIVKSLDRNAIERWPDAKLALIGAQRKLIEDYTYSLKGDRK